MRNDADDPPERSPRDATQPSAQPVEHRREERPQPHDARGDHLVDLWLAARRAVATLERTMESRLREEVGISSPRYALLCATGSPGATNQQGISAALGLNKSSISRQVEAAVHDGHLAVGSTPGSRRDKQVELTPEGRALLERADAVLAVLARDIDVRDAGTALQVLDGLASATVR